MYDTEIPERVQGDLRSVLEQMINSGQSEAKAIAHVVCTALETWSDSPEELAVFVADEFVGWGEALRKSSLPKRLIATFRPQAWVNDQAVYIDGDVDFDATEQFLKLSLEEIVNFKFYNYDSDYMAQDLPEHDFHRGPFEVDMELAVEDFFEANYIQEWGKLTQDQLDDLRKKYNVTTEKERRSQHER